MRANEGKEWGSIPSDNLDESRIIRERLINGNHLRSIYQGSLEGKSIAIREIKLDKNDKYLMESIACEIEGVALLRNIPYNLQYFGHFKKNAKICIVTEFYQNSLLNRASLLGVAEEQILIFLLKLFIGLECLHARGLIHGDINLENILIDQKNEPKLQGLTIGRGMRGFKPLGTPLYAPPEYFKDNIQYSPAYDIWSAGLVIYELLQQKHYYPNPAQIEETHQAIAARSFSPSWSAIRNESIKQLLAQMIVYDPTQRYTAQQVITHLKQLLPPSIVASLPSPSQLPPQSNGPIFRKIEEKKGQNETIFPPPSGGIKHFKTEKPPTNDEKRLEKDTTKEKQKLQSKNPTDSGKNHCSLM